MLDLLSWVIDLAALDIRRMSPFGVVIAVVFYGGFGMLFIVAALVKIAYGAKGAELYGGLLVVGLGVALLARIGYGLFDCWRGGPADDSVFADD